MSDLREAYKMWGDELDEILRDPTPEELAGYRPAFAGVIPEHTPKHPDGSPFTEADYLALARETYRAHQKRKLIDMLILERKW